MINAILETLLNPAFNKVILFICICLILFFLYKLIMLVFEMSEERHEEILYKLQNIEKELRELKEL